ncbi:MAG: YafY family transcriptional regulator [Anaerolineae bacterium]|nr:YafY family transcriptional regulator [Anaerolineae bacterium]
MRADRLLSILMLLQARGKMTAQALADEVEMSVRTIYRDLDALSAAGVPVYAERGPGGGCMLLDSYRTTLTGLTRDEVRALFALSIPAPLADLGIDDEVRAALHKLSASLPASRRSDEAGTRQRIHLDPRGWSSSQAPAPHLQAIYQAVWDDRRVELTVCLPFDTTSRVVVEPLGLVAKANAWYLVARRDEHTRVYRLADVVEARALDKAFARESGFDLVDFWQAWCMRVEASRAHHVATIRVSPDLWPLLPYYLGREARLDLTSGDEPGDGQWRTATVFFESLEEARMRLLGCGRAVEIVAPRVLRETVADYAAQVAALYAPA